MKAPWDTIGTRSWFAGAVHGSGGGGNTTQIQKSDPWSVAANYTAGVPAAQAPGTLRIPGFNGQFANDAPGTFPLATSLLTTGGPQYYPGTTYSPETAAQAGAIAGQENLGLTGSPVTGAATNSALDILNPAFRTSNPGNAAYQDIINGGPGMQAAIQRATPGLLDTFTAGNRLNSPGAAYAVSRGIGDAAAAAELQAAGGLSSNYNTAAGQQNTAGLVAPSTQGLAYTDLTNAFNAGTQQQTLGQNVINDAIARYNYGQTTPYNLVDWYNSVISGQPGGTIALSTPFFKPSQAATAAGGALAGAGTGAMIGSAIPGVGTLIGAGVGAVGGGLLGGFA